jgi:hypothetical protein
MASHNRLNIIPPRLEDDKQPRRSLPETAARHELAGGCAGDSGVRNRVYLDRFLGDFLFNVRNNSCAEGGGGTALSKTIASAVIGLP